MAFWIDAIHTMQSYNYIANLRAVYADFLSLFIFLSLLLLPFAKILIFSVGCVSHLTAQFHSVYAVVLNVLELIEFK